VCARAHNSDNPKLRIFQNGHFRFSEVLGKSTYARNAYLLQPCAGRIPHTPVPPPLLQTVTIRDLTFAGVPKGGACVRSDGTIIAIITYTLCGRFASVCVTQDFHVGGCDNMTQVEMRICVDDRAFGEYNALQMIDMGLWVSDQMISPRGVILGGFSVGTLREKRAVPVLRRDYAPGYRNV